MQLTDKDGNIFGTGGLEVTTSDGKPKTLVIPQYTTAQRNTLTPTVGYLIYNTTEGYLEIYDNFWGWMPVAGQNEWKRKYGFEYFSDFGQSDGTLGAGAFGTGQGNGGANIQGFYYGCITLITGTTTNSGYRVASNSYIALGGGKTLFTAGCSFAQVSNLTDRYYIQIGFFDVFGANQTDAVCFVYDNGGIASGSTATNNWQCLTSSNGVRTWTTTSIPVTTAYRNLKIEINSSGTQVLFFIDEVLVATHTTNIPIGTSRSVQFGTSMVKATGTASLQTIVLDYVGLKMKLTTPR